MTEPEYMTRYEVMAYTRMSESTLWRKGPKGTRELMPVKIGRSCRYRRVDVVAFMESHLVSTDAPG